MGKTEKVLVKDVAGTWYLVDKIILGASVGPETALKAAAKERIARREKIKDMLRLMDLTDQAILLHELIPDDPPDPPAPPDPPPDPPAPKPDPKPDPKPEPKPDPPDPPAPPEPPDPPDPGPGWNRWVASYNKWRANYSLWRSALIQEAWNRLRDR